MITSKLLNILLPFLLLLTTLITATPIATTTSACDSNCEFLYARCYNLIPTPRRASFCHEQLCHTTHQQTVSRKP